MLSNKIFLETYIQRLLDGLFFVGKGVGVHVQRILKMSRPTFCLFESGRFTQVLMYF